MDWSYVAGFFDGEGCIYIQKKAKSRGFASPCLMVGQAIQNRAPIDALHRFLDSHSIFHAIDTQRLQLPNHDFVRIRISRHKDAAVFLRATLPFLILKRDKAIAALAFIDTHQWEPRYTESEYRDAYVLYQQGMSTRDVAAMVAIDHRSLGRTWRLLGLPTRTQRTAAGMWRGRRRAA